MREGGKKTSANLLALRYLLGKTGKKPKKASTRKGRANQEKKKERKSFPPFFFFYENHRGDKSRGRVTRKLT